MNLRIGQFFSRLRSTLRSGMSGPPILAFFPALVLVGFWVGGEQMLIMIALGFPLCLAFAGVLGNPHPPHLFESEDGTDRRGFEGALDTAARIADQSSRKTGCILLKVDDYPSTCARLGVDATDAMMTHMVDRMRATVRSRDLVSRMGDDLFGVSIAPVRQLDLGNALHLASRLQNAIEEPFSLNSTTIQASVSVGFALSTNLPRKTGSALMDAAEMALSEARRHGPSAMRAYSQDMQTPYVQTDNAHAKEVCEALESGQIHPWFQPQISTDTGHVTGFEALARWSHPKHGLIPPSGFLPALEQSSRMEKLGKVILHGAFCALKAWDHAGVNVPTVGVNFSPEELRNPRLVERIEWELDRFELNPNRLNIEILETVVATSPDDTVVRNIGALSKLGCQIDLDDFGTGHASISSIRRFDVQRLKIDRSFVMKVDREPEQQRMVSAILLMAERLELDTLAEGVETAGEHAMLAQLGCGHVQGFGIGRPMAFDKTGEWVAAHLARLKDPPKIGRQTG